MCISRCLNSGHLAQVSVWSTVLAHIDHSCKRERGREDTEQLRGLIRDRALKLSRTRRPHHCERAALCSGLPDYLMQVTQIALNLSLILVRFCERVTLGINLKQTFKGLWHDHITNEFHGGSMEIAEGKCNCQGG